jgi:hypothetical protein
VIVDVDPVLDGEVGHPPVVPDVARHEGQLVADRNRGDPQVRLGERCSGPFQISLQSAEDPGRPAIEREYDR